MELGPAMRPTAVPSPDLPLSVRLVWGDRFFVGKSSCLSSWFGLNGSLCHPNLHWHVLSVQRSKGSNLPVTQGVLLTW